MKKFLKILLIILLFPFYLNSDNIVDKGNCNTSLDDYGGKAFLTFFGDSLGDYVDDAPWGWVGWDAYLHFHRPDIDWRVQNLAVGGSRTKNVFKYLEKCTDTENRKVFKTANHVALEIGGNDFIDWFPILAYMPWKFSSYTDPITEKKVVGSTEYILHNTKAIVRFLRHPLIDRDVLVMGNFPALSYSPTLGNIGDYFHFEKKILDDFYKKFQEVEGPLQITREDNAKLLDAFIRAFHPLINVFNVDKLMEEGVLAISNGITGAFDDLSVQLGMSQPEVYDLKTYYMKWLHTVEHNPTMVFSLGLFFTQPGLEQMAMEEKEYTRNVTKVISDPDGKKEDYTVPNRKGGDYVYFLSLYPLLVRQTDCLNWGQCWVGEPVFFRDATPGHLNHLGYAVWSSQLAKKLSDLKWYEAETPRWKDHNEQGYNEGYVTVLKVPFDKQPDIDVEIEPYEAPPPPSNIDWLILLCFIFGKCRF